MEIDKLIVGFNTHTLPKEEWTHPAHLIVALWYVKYFGEEMAGKELNKRISAYNAAVGGVNSNTEGYHETITLAWIKIVNQFLNIQTGTFEALALKLTSVDFTRNHHPLNFYSKEVLDSVTARKSWVEPDIKPIKLQI